MESIEDKYDRIMAERKSEPSLGARCYSRIKDCCSPFCLGGATVFGVAVLGYDIATYTASDMIEHLYRQAGEAISSLPYNFTGSEIGEPVSSARESFRGYLSDSVEMASKKFAVSWAIGYFVSRKIRGPFMNWMVGRKKNARG
jgi:hypothetical protein